MGSLPDPYSVLTKWRTASARAAEGTYHYGQRLQQLLLIVRQAVDTRSKNRLHRAELEPILNRHFAALPREKFLGPGPWEIARPRRSGYAFSESDDPSLVYVDALIALGSGFRS